jgi:DNA polymerase elongation subunit (family B)
MNRKQISNGQIGWSQATADRRTVVLDIETAALDPSQEKGALDAMTGRVVCIGMLIDAGDTVSEIMLADDDEHVLISGFWNTVRPGDVFVGHNVLDFDIQFLRQRSWILGIQPSRAIDTRKYYTADVIDTLQLWTKWTGSKKGVTLDALGSALGCGRKSGEGTGVAEWWAVRDIESIKRYCADDVRLTYGVYCRLTYQDAKKLALNERQSFAATEVETTATTVVEVSLT